MEQIHQGHLGTSKCQYRARQCVYWPGINKDIKQLVEACPTCQRHRPQEPRQPLKPTPPLEQAWQQLGADFMMFDGSEYLVIIDYYSKMPIVRKMPTSQCNSAKMITVLKELFAEHGIPEEIRSDNGPQFASHLFAEFTKDWNIKHTRSSPQNPRSNGQAESAVKIVKGLLTHAKCSGQDPYLALLAYRSTQVDSHLRSPAEMLYQCALCTTVPQQIRHKDPYGAAECERLEECATQSAANHNCTGCCRKAPLYAGQHAQPIMAHTSSKSLVELNTDEHETTFVNITQMLSSLTHTPRLKWLDNPSPLYQPQKLYSYIKYLTHTPRLKWLDNPSPLHQPQKLYSYIKYLLLPQYNCLLLLQHPSKLQPKALQQQPTSSGRHLQLQMFNHLTDLVVSVRHHNALLSICKYQP